MAIQQIPADLLHNLLRQVAEVAVQNGTLSVQRIDDNVVRGFWLKKDELLQGDAVFVSTLGECYHYGGNPTVVKDNALGAIPLKLQQFQPTSDERFGLALASVAWLNQRQEVIGPQKEVLTDKLLELLRERRH